MRRLVVFLSVLAVCRISAAPVLVWTFADGLAGWTPANWETTAVSPDGFVGLSKYDCQLLSPKLDIAASDYAELVVRMTTDTSGSGETFFRSNGQGLNDARKARHMAIASPEPRLYHIPLRGAPGWEGQIEAIRFDPLNPAGAKIRIEFIALMPEPGMAPVNGSMEMTQDGHPLGWKATGDGASVTHETPHSGASALRLVPGGTWSLDPFDLSLLGAYRLDGYVRGNGTLLPQIAFLDGNGAERHTADLALDRVPATNWQPFTATFTCPRDAYQAVVRFAAKDGTVELDDVYLTRLAPGNIVDPGPPRPQWQAAWIWHPDALDRDDQTVHFRYELVVPDRPIRLARLQITADDGYALSVNSQELERQFGVTDGWRTPEVVDLAPVLKPGTNRIEVEAHDIASAQGLIAEGIITFADGSEQAIRTGSAWLAALDPAGPWVAARELGTPPCPPWRDLPSVDLAAPVPVSGTLQVTLDTSAQPSLAATLDLALQKDTPRPVFAQLQLRRGDAVLVEAWADREALPADTRAGGKTTLHWRLPLPYGLPPGPATVTCRLRGTAFVPSLPSTTVNLPTPPVAGDFPKAECRTIDGLPRLFVDGTEIDPTQAFFIRPDQLQQDNARQARMPILCVSLDDIGFTESGFDYTKVDNLLAAYLGACPEAWIIPNFTFDTRYQPWWIKAHPEAHCRLEDGSDLIGDYHGSRRIVPGYASEVWRDTYTDALRRLIRHLKGTPFASRIIGFHPCSGITTEWFHWGAQSGELVDYSEAGQRDFRRWLAGTYDTDGALRQAWHQPEVSLATATIPSGERRRTPGLGIFFDPLTQQDVLDYNRYQHDVVADTIAHFARVIKEETNGRSLAGTYYGYVTHLPETPGFCQGSGHFSLHRLLECPDIDFLMAPLAYAWREPGSPGASMTATASHALNGKLWWHQEDLRTHWVQPAAYGASSTLQETLDVFRRELARNLAQGTAIQWFDFSLGWIFGDDRVTAEVGRLRELDVSRTQGKEWPRSTYLAVIVDEEQMGTFDPFHPPYGLDLIYRQRDYLNRAGIPWKCYLFSDLRRHPELLEHRAFLFLNLFRLSDSDRSFLQEKVMTGGRTVGFVGPAGILTATGLAPEASGKLLGLDMVRLPDDTPFQATFATTLPAPWAEFADKTVRKTSARPPLLGAQGAKGALALFDSRNEAAVVAEVRDGYRLFWSAIPGLLPEHLRALARFADIPVLSTTNDTVYCGYGFVALHAADDGERTLALPAPAAVRDLFSGQTWPAGTRQVTVPLRHGQTVLLLATP